MPRISLTLALLVISLTACTVPKTPTQTVIPQITATFTPTASQTPEPSVTRTPNPTENAQATLSANILEIKPTNSPLPTEVPIDEFLAPVSQLTAKEPTIEQIIGYLTSTIHLDISSSLSEPEIFTEDLTGDSQTELVFSSGSDIVVFSWTGEEYQILSYNYGPCGGVGCSSKVTFEDWTTDEIPEIIFDITTIDGGFGGLRTLNTTRYIIHCELSNCRLVWEGSLLFMQDDYFDGFMSRFWLEMEIVTENDQVKLRTISHGFTIYNRTTYSFPDEGIDFNLEKVNEKILDQYVWDGINFKISSTEIVQLAYEVDKQANYSAQGKSGTLAQLYIEIPVEPVSPKNENCALVIGTSFSSEEVPCKHDFVTVGWQDITGDKVDEVVVKFLFGTVVDEQFIPCAVQQRLLAYTWDGQIATLIADASGCVTRPEDLYGVRLEDYDGDDLPEIIAAQINADNPERIYKFNGTEFVFWSEMPQK